MRSHLYSLMMKTAISTHLGAHGTFEGALQLLITYYG